MNPLASLLGMTAEDAYALMLALVKSRTPRLSLYNAQGEVQLEVQ